MMMFYLSFSDDARFLGGTVVAATSPKDAIEQTYRLGINPGGKALICEVPEDQESNPDVISIFNRLATKAELLAMGAMVIHS